MIAEGEDLYDDLYEDVGDTLLYKAPFQSLHEVRDSSVPYFGQMVVHDALLLLPESEHRR